MAALLQEEVVSLSTQLQQLRDQFGQKTTEQLDLKAKADLMERRLTAASKLIVGLSSERTRWTADMQVSILHPSCCTVRPDEGYCSSLAHLLPCPVRYTPDIYSITSEMLKILWQLSQALKFFVRGLLALM